MHRIEKRENTYQIFFEKLSNDVKLNPAPPPPGGGAGANFEILNRNPNFLLQIQIPQKKLH